MWGPYLGFWKHLQIRGTHPGFLKTQINKCGSPHHGHSFFFNMMSESWISTTIQDWVQILVFEMVDFLVQQVFGKQILLRGVLNLQWSGFQQSPRAVLAVQFWRCSSGRVLVQFWCSSDAVLLRAVLIGFSSGADVLTCLFAVLVACLCAYLLACQFAYLIVCLHAR